MNILEFVIFYVNNIVFKFIVDLVCIYIIEGFNKFLGFYFCKWMVIRFLWLDKNKNSDGDVDY